MCTVTLVTFGQAGNFRWRLACNRDESHTRPAAQPPQSQSFGRRQALLPIDPSSGGTWIAVNDAAVTATLLNVNLPADDGPTQRAGDVQAAESRGTIIPSLLHCDDARAAADLAGAIEPRRYLPFRLFIFDDQFMADVYSDGAKLKVTGEELAARPLMFTSSGLGDHVVEPPRQRLFEQMFAEKPDVQLIGAQDDYHHHTWQDRRHESVCMYREDARTVSTTIVERLNDAVEMAYQPKPPPRPQPRDQSPDRQPPPARVRLAVHV